MNSGSEQKLSMNELLEKNRPAQMVQTTPQPPAQELTPPPEVHPTKAEWEDLQSDLYTLGYHTERQTGYLKKISELLAQLPTRTHLEQMSEQAGKQKERHFSLPGIRPPRLRMPHLDGPTWAVLLMGTAALLLLWWGLDTVWSSLSLMLL